VSIYAASKEPSLDDVRQTLRELVQNFEADAPGNRRLIRELLENDRSAFYSSTIGILKEADDSRGVQYLVALLVANGMLLEAICDPVFNREEAYALGRAAIRIDPAADASLARGLADSQTGQGTVAVHDAPRLMEVLCEIGDPGRMMASMLRLLRHPNPYLRSKAVKVVGRGSKSPKWVRQRLAEPDPRVRANAIESLWSVNTTEARSLLQFAITEDGHNRVVANALLGLYYLGDSSVLSSLARMAQDESGVVRSSAAWAMGETGDIRFQEFLRRMLHDSDATARRRAFAAIGRLKVNSPQTFENAVWHVAARIYTEDAKGMRRALVAVAADDSRELPPVPPLGFHLSECGSNVMSYKVTDRPAPEAMSVVFLIPREAEAAAPFREGIESCLKWKRTSDLWCVLPYIESGDGVLPEPDMDPDPPQFAVAPDALRKTLSDPARRLECGDLWSSVWRGAKLDCGVARGIRHIFILSSAEESRLAGHGVLGKAQNPRVQVHGISAVPNQRVAEFCAKVDAPMRVVDRAEIAETVRQSYLALLARYEVSYQPVNPEASALKIRVQAHGGAGEVTIAYRAEQEPPAEG
jgi:HEAT repeat protein